MIFGYVWFFSLSTAVLHQIFCAYRDATMMARRWKCIDTMHTVVWYSGSMVYSVPTTRFRFPVASIKYGFDVSFTRMYSIIRKMFFRWFGSFIRIQMVWPTHISKIGAIYWCWLIPHVDFMQSFALLCYLQLLRLIMCLWTWKQKKLDYNWLREYKRHNIKSSKVAIHEVINNWLEKAI